MAIEVQIEKNIPVPAQLGGSTKYPFRRMAVGDSFFVHCETEDRLVSVRQRIAQASHQCGKRHNMRFSTRTVRADLTGVRCWRIA